MSGFVYKENIFFCAHDITVRENDKGKSVRMSKSGDEIGECINCDV